MTRSRLSILLGGLLLIVAIAVVVVVYRPAKTVPPSLNGDPWDYAIRPEDVPAGWTALQQDITTAYDLAQAKLEAAGAMTPTVSLTQSATLQNMTQMYTVEYQSPDAAAFSELTCQVVLYQADTNAGSALAAEAPGGEWEAVVPPALGDGARLWHFKNPDPSDKEQIFRLDFRYLNGLASVTLTDPAALDAHAVTGYASRVLDKMKKASTPPDLKSLQAAGFPDLRRYLLTQAQMAQADPYLGNRWVWSTSQLPGWTPTGIMSQAAQQAVAPLGRVTGYQMFFYKPLSQDELNGAMPVALFQQVTAYTQAANAQKGLDLMAGIPEVPAAPKPSQIGDGQSRAWNGEVSTTLGDGTKALIALDEIDFRVGNYVASVKLQSRPLNANEISQVDKSTNQVHAGTGLLQISQMAETYAKLLAADLQRAHP